MKELKSPGDLIKRLIWYYLILIGSLVALGSAAPDVLNLMPFGGVDAIESVALNIDDDSVSLRTTRPSDSPDSTIQSPAASQIGMVAAYLVFFAPGDDSRHGAHRLDVRRDQAGNRIQKEFLSAH